ncbi:MAG: carbamoyltransferase [Planctomycetota bacterium]|nr:carbamoyltransferase [Planctomycetota bacterium]MDA0931945.1 carbamoyltransferase [Planctomycetota bacterium]MDA1220937.1 carbamoyltransferase [Planctomycetota bacterium]
MPTYILGISAFYHDSAAALLCDGEIVAAAQEERFSRKKHDERFPRHAVQHCLDAAGIRVEDLDYVAFYDKPLLKFDRLMETYLSYAPSGFRSFAKFLPVWLGDKLHIPRILKRELGAMPKNPFVFPEHHESHAASAFFPSPFEEAAIVTMDGVGEWATTSIGVGEGNQMRLTHEIRFPHSLGLLYSAFTYYCGFKVNSGEYKLMGLAPYGEAKYVDRIMKMIDLRDDGSYRLDMRYFNYAQGLTMTNSLFEEQMGAPRRKAETELTQFYMDVAASIQKVTEDVMLRTVRYAHKVTGKKNLCLAGGVALNCVGNGKILREGPFEKVWIQPAAGDAGGALGAAQMVWYHLLKNERTTQPELDNQSASLLGPAFSRGEIHAVLQEQGVVFEEYSDENELCERVADLIANENVIGWFQGRMEFGPRALGSRSIIGDARSPKMQSVMNLKIKFRESFRPFAPIVLRERAHEYFDIREDQDSPYMLIVAPVREEKRRPVEDGKFGIEKLNQLRSDVPAITHVDYSARLQTIDDRRNPRLAKLMQAFEAKTGSPVLINTSFNIRGEPIVCTPSDAIRCFLGTEMDVLVLENFVLLRTAQDPSLTAVDREKYLASFALD